MRGDLRRYAAANARVRSLAAGLLGRRGLEALYGLPSPAAMHEALGGTRYGAGEAGAGTGAPAVLRAGRAVLSSMAGAEADLVRHYLLWYEVANLQVVVRAVAHGHAWSTTAPHLVPLAGAGTLDLEALAGAGDLAGLVVRLAGTRYGEPLRRALPRVAELGPLALEVALEQQHWRDLWGRAGALAPSDAACARRLLGVLLDVLNLRRLARWRDALGLSPGETLALALPGGRWIGERALEALAREPGRPWAASVGRTPWAAPLADADAARLDDASPGLWRVLALEARRALGGYPFSIGVPLGFLVTQEIESRDLAVLLAAKRLGTPADEALARCATVRGGGGC